MNESFTDIVRKMVEYEDKFNSAEIPYYARFQNSNSYSGSFVRSLGFAGALPDRWAPGWGTDLNNAVNWKANYLLGAGK